MTTSTATPTKRPPLAVVILAAGQGTRVTLKLDGPDETEAMEAAHALFTRGFDEQESA